ncbi:MAG: DUF86 domain-containing protein [Candidatus Electrothrix sp. AUS4]|nr:DUF86 domain-containing protein [Candidatus Electrothrix sp. AUS4]
MKDQRLYLIHIRECIEKIEEYTGEGESVFSADSKTQDAVVRNFEIIGEATKRISEEVRQLVPHIPWREIAGFRDVLIHQYDGVDMAEVWMTVEQDLPALKEAVRLLLERDELP